MESMAAVTALAGLAQPSRLAVFRLLVEQGPTGLAAGEIARRLSIPATTLSFHLNQLSAAGLATSRREGRSIRYTADFTTMNDLIAYLTDNCCGGDLSACAPSTDATATRAPRESPK